MGDSNALGGKFGEGVGNFFGVFDAFLVCLMLSQRFLRIV